MNRTTRRGSFRGKVAFNSTQQRSKAANYGHLLLPRGVNIFKEEAGGRIALDFLPYIVEDSHHPDRDEEREIAIEGTLWYRRPYKLHRAIGVTNVSIICPLSIGRKCPICEHRAALLEKGAKWQDPEIKAMRPSDRNLYYVIPKGHTKFEEKPYLWDMSQFLFQEALNNELEENEEFGDFPDLEHGLTLRIRFSEEKFEKNSFAKTSRIDFEERDYAYGEEILDNLPSLDKMLDIKDYKDVEKAFFETAGVEDEDDPPVETKVVRQPRQPREADEASEATDRPATVTVLHRRRPAAESEPAQEAEPKTVVRQRRSPVPQTNQEEEGAEEASAPVRTVASTTKSAAPIMRRASSTNECPAGYRFGVDTDTKDECENCKVWDACMDAKEAAQ